jgi:hypothetical protein
LRPAFRDGGGEGDRAVGDAVAADRDGGDQT